MSKNPFSTHRVGNICARSFGIPAILSFLCFSAAGPSALGQSKTVQSKTGQSQHYSVTHYKSASHIHNVDQHPHSVPSSIVPEVIGKSSAKTAGSSQKELDQLERASLVKPLKVNHARVQRAPATKASTAHSSQHSEPIAFSYKPLPTTRQAPVAKAR